jgi:transposase
MPRGSNFQKPYPPEFRREAVALFRSSGRSLREIAGDLGVSSESLRIWVKQSAIDAGEREGFSTEERTELRELRRRVWTLEQEREILKKPRPSSRGRARRGELVSVHRGGEGQLPDLVALPDAGRLAVRLSRLAASGAVGPGARGRVAGRADPRHPCREPPDLRRLARAPGAASPRRPRRSQTGGAADAARTHVGAGTEALPAHDDPRAGRACRRRSRRARLPAGRAEPPLVRRHQVRAHLAGMALPCRGDGLLLAPDCRLVDASVLASYARPRVVRHG